MAKKRIQPNDEEIARRAMGLARQVSGRLFVSRDGVYLVSGMPCSEKLRDCLAGLPEPLQGSNALTPMDLGFAPTQIVPLNSERLTTWGRGLQKWRKILNDYETPRQKTSERRQRYRRWRGEIDQLSRTIEYLWQTLRQWEGKHTIPAAPYVSEHTFGAIHDGDDPRDLFTEPLWVLLERIVIWIAGSSAGRRFHDSLRPFAEGHASGASRAFAAKPPPPPLPSTLVGLAAALCATDGAVSLVPPWLLSVGDLESRDARKRVFVELFKTGGAVSLVPPWLLAVGDLESIDARKRVFDELFKEQAQPGYDLLLQAMAKMPHVSGDQLRAIREFLVVGVEVGDIEWALAHLSRGARTLAHAGLSPRPLRTLVSTLERAGLTLCDRGPDSDLPPRPLRALVSTLERAGLTLYDMGPDSDLPHVAERLAQCGRIKIVEAFSLWLSSLNPIALDANLAKWAWNCFRQLLILQGVSPALRDLLRQWADPPASGNRDDPLTAAASPEMRAWLSRLSYYQRLCGQPPSLPRSVVKMLTFQDRQARELEHLRKARNSGRLSDRMAARLALLEGREMGPPVIAEQRILRQIQEACAHTALEAARCLARREGRRVWEHTFDYKPFSHLTEDEIAAIAAWVAELDETELKHFQELLSAWRQSGADYRRGLSLNATWMKAAAGRIDLHAWFVPDPCHAAVEGMPVTVCVVSDPFRILLMGTYFGSCLSLDGMYNKAVLTNAYDANKAVVFALDSEGQVLARKLVCVNSVFHLIGYETHIAAGNSLAEKRREGIASLVDAYCGRWARRAGMPLGFMGAPVKLSGLFWHEDAVTHWLPIAKCMWADPTSDGVVAATTQCGLMPRLGAALETRRDRCIQMLVELGIWPPVNSEAHEGLGAFPGLAEETLAVLARAEQDRELAQLVFENALTYGGQVEAMTSVALLEKTDAMAEHVFAVGLQWYMGWLPERAMEILRGIGTRRAWQCCMGLSFRNCVDSLWLPLAAADSDVSAEALIEALRVLALHHDWTDYESVDERMTAPCLLPTMDHPFLLAIELLSACGRTLPQAEIETLLLWSRLRPEAQCSLAQWMPACPDVLKHPHIEQYAPMAAVILAMKDHGRNSTTYLMGRSEKDPSALLALSLLSGNEYREFIRKTVLAGPAELAAILSLLVSEGDEAAAEMLAPTISMFPNQEERLECARDLHAAFHSLDTGKPVSCLGNTCNRSAESLSTLPYVLSWLWQWLDVERPNIGAVAALMDSSDCMDLFEAHHVDLCGLAARMARILRETDGKNAILLREALLKLADLDGMRQLGRYTLLLDKLSGQKLWTNAPAGDHAPVWIEDSLGCSGIWALLLDEAGDLRPVLERAVWGISEDLQFPLDFKVAARVVRLLPNFVPANGLIKNNRVMTEIQRRLVIRYIPPDP